MKYLLLITLIVVSLTGTVQASERATSPTPFAPNFGKYTISSCKYLAGQREQSPDSWCSNYSQVEIGKNPQGKVYITLSNSGGGSFGFPMEIFDNSEPSMNIKDTATYEEDGSGCNRWRHALALDVHQGLRVNEIEYFSFCINSQTKKMSLSRDQFKYENGARQYWYRHIFWLTPVTQ